MQCSESSGTSANVFATLEPNSQHFEKEGKSHHMKYFTHFTIVAFCDGLHLIVESEQNG